MEDVTSTPIRPVENVVITTKGLQNRNNLLLDGGTVENKGKVSYFSLPVALTVKMTKTFQMARSENC